MNKKQEPKLTEKAAQYAIVDIEMTGCNSSGSRITEIATVIHDRKNLARWETLGQYREGHPCPDLRGVWDRKRSSGTLRTVPLRKSNHSSNQKVLAPICGCKVREEHLEI